MKISALKESLLPVFERHRSRLAAAYLFGSTPREESGPLSDIDIAVLLYPADRMQHGEFRLTLHADLCRALKRNDIDLVIMNTARNLFLLDEIIRQGVLLFDADSGFRVEFEAKILHNSIEFRTRRQEVMGV